MHLAQCFAIAIGQHIYMLQDNLTCLVCRSPAEHSWSSHVAGNLPARQHWSRRSVAEPLISCAAHVHNIKGLADTSMVESTSRRHPVCSTKEASAVAYGRSCNFQTNGCPGIMHSTHTATDKTSLSAHQRSMSDVDSRQNRDIPRLDRLCSAMLL